MTDNLFNRTELLLGSEAMKLIRSKRVIIFGIGGVGSWCAECPVREGIEHLTLVDSDVVCVTNCNRQLMATTKTIGEPKVEALRKRLLDINPEADIIALQKNFSEEIASDFCIETYDYVIDAIDSLKDKISLIMKATRPIQNSKFKIQNDGGCQNICPLTSSAVASGAGGTLTPLTSLTSPKTTPKLYSSMGAALRIDPTKVRVSEFWKIKGDPLAAAMRSAMRRHKLFPARKFLCVHSEEAPLPNLGKALHDGSQTFNKVQTNGSLAHITAIFGMTLSGLVIQDINRQGK